MGEHFSLLTAVVQLPQIQIKWIPVEVFQIIQFLVFNVFCIHIYINILFLILFFIFLQKYKFYKMNSRQDKVPIWHLNCLERYMRLWIYGIYNVWLDIHTWKPHWVPRSGAKRRQRETRGYTYITAHLRIPLSAHHIQTDP